MTAIAPHACNEEQHRCPRCGFARCYECEAHGVDDLPADSDYEYQGSELCEPCWDAEHHLAEQRAEERTCDGCGSRWCRCDEAYERSVDERMEMER